MIHLGKNTRRIIQGIRRVLENTYRGQVSHRKAATHAITQCDSC